MPPNSNHPSVATSRPSQSNSPAASPADGQFTPRLWKTLVVLCTAMFLDALDLSMVGVALPSIGVDLSMSTTALQWVVSGYVLGFGGFLLLGGRAADLLGRREVFLISLTVFALASLLGGFADSGPLLIASRFVKGVSAAFTAPAGLSIITTTFPEGTMRNRALSIYTTCAAAGFSLGLVLSGVLTEASWRLTMLLPAPIAVVAVVAGLRLLPASHRNTSHNSYDLPGALLGTSAMLLLVYTVVQAPEVGWGHPRTLVSAALVLLLLRTFQVVERRTPAPLVRLGIFMSANQLRAHFGALAYMGTYISFQFIASLYMQSLLGWSALHTAMYFLPSGLIVALVSTRISAAVRRFGTESLLAAGFALMAAGYTYFVLRLDLQASQAGVVLPAIVIIGIGSALAFPSINIQATNGVSDDEQGMASGLVNTSFQIGGALLLAVVSAVVVGVAPDPTRATEVLNGFRMGMWVVVAVAVTAAVTNIVGRRPDAGRAD